MTIGILPGARAHLVQGHVSATGTVTGTAAGAVSADDFSGTSLLDELKKVFPPVPGRLDDVIRPKAFRPFV